MKRIYKFIFYIELLIINQLLFMIFPLLIAPDRYFLVVLFMPLNALGCLYMIKRIEMIYYKKFNKLSSMLYMACPLIATIVFYLISLLIKSNSLETLSFYYVILFLNVYLFNFEYIMIQERKKVR